MSGACSVLLTQGEERAVLAACRGLYAAGLSVGVAASSRPAAACWSRCCARRLRLADSLAFPEAFVDGLVEAVGGGEYAILLPGNDASLLLVSEARERLERHVRLGLPCRATVRRVLDKRTLLGVAERSGLACPRSLVCESAPARAAAAAELGFPLILKPASAVAWAGGSLKREGAKLVGDRDALEWAAGRLGEPVIAQRYEPGARVVWVSGVAAEGKLLATGGGRFRRSWPPRAGSASFADSFDPPLWLRERVRTLVSALGWQGLFQLQLLERPNGDYAAIDFNPRPYGSLALDIAQGANLPAIWCRWLLTNSTPNPTTIAPVPTSRAAHSYRWEEGELRNLLHHLRKRDTRQAAALLSPTRPFTNAYFTLHDPLPLAAWMLASLKRATRRLIQPTHRS